MTYQLPEPAIEHQRNGKVTVYYTKRQMQAAYQAGRDSMKAEWVGLADYEITACLRNSSWPDIAKAIESKLREKNST